MKKNESVIRNILKRYPSQLSLLIAVLKDIQMTFGYIPAHAITEIAQHCGVADDQIYMIIADCDSLSLQPSGQCNTDDCAERASHVGKTQQQRLRSNAATAKTDQRGTYAITSKCTGCHACVKVCPHQAITGSRKHIHTINADLCDQCGLCIEACKFDAIQNREHDVAVCSVDAQQCRGCGICEEVCPLSIPQVKLKRTGEIEAFISSSACVGCGICVGACPTGAVGAKNVAAYCESDIFSKAAAGLIDKTIVFACAKSVLSDKSDQEFIVRVPCIARVSVDMILEGLARGARGVALVCRDSNNCPFREGGKRAAAYGSVAKQLAAYTGLGEQRVEYICPNQGLKKLTEALRHFSTHLAPTPLMTSLESDLLHTRGMDRAREIIQWLKQRSELIPSLPQSLAAVFGAIDDNTTASVLYLGDLPELDLLLSLVVGEWQVRKLVADAISFLKKLSIPFRPVFTEQMIRQSNAQRVITFSAETLSSLRHSCEVVTLNELAGYKDIQKSSEPFRFTLPASQRKTLIEKLKSSNPYSAALTPADIIQMRFLQRSGAWHEVIEAVPNMAFAEKAASENFPQCDQKQTAGNRRIAAHPILPSGDEPVIDFTFNGRPLKARKGEVISSALYAAGISVFGHHRKDGGAQGIFCVNGQCSQCTVIANGTPVKSCMTPVTPAMAVESCEGLPALAQDNTSFSGNSHTEDRAVEVLIIGGGPAGISAAIELGRLGVEVLLVDDKGELGGKLSLQTHNFFGSVHECYAGTRGIDIGYLLADELNEFSSVEVWLNTTVIGVYNDKKFGIAREGKFQLITPQTVLITAGAREKSLSFPGCDLPGVYGAGAFQTLVNRDLVRCAEKLFIIGGGNVGLIGAYHALQAGIDVVGLVEALARCGGYKVHEDKIKRLGVPVWTSHTVLRVEGNDRVERVVIAQIDKSFQVIPGTERSFCVDTVLVAVGLAPVDELYRKAQEYGMDVYAAGDAEEIAEASAAIFSGKIVGRKIARKRGVDITIPQDWEELMTLLKHRPTEPVAFTPDDISAPVYPVIRCVQEIPCNPCIEVCPKNLITMDGNILSLPQFRGECIGCAKCVLACPGLAINLVINDYDPSGEHVLILMPFEFDDAVIPLGKEVITTDIEGNVVGSGKVIAVRKRESQDRRKLILVEVPQEDKLHVAGFQIREPNHGVALQEHVSAEEDPIVCRCERVRKSEIVKEIRAGVRDVNQLKAITRAGLGGCGGKTCTELIMRIFREEGIPLSEVEKPSIRPLIAEIHLGDFINTKNNKEVQ